MHHFAVRDGHLHAEDVALATIADAVGTPTYIYSRATLERHWHAMDAALAGVPHTICYSVKACSNLAVLQLLARLGSGFDIVSAGELARVLRAGGDPARTVFSGVGKRDDEIALALRHGLLSLNVESAGELARIEQVAAALGLRAPVSLRVNPDVDAGTHPYIATGLRTSKFGIDIGAALDLYRLAAASKHLRVVGIDSHIGSQILELAPLIEAIDKVLGLVGRLAREGIALHHIDIGGGLGIAYRDEATVTPAELGRHVCERVRGHGLHLIVEPGRMIAGNAGILLTRVVGTKHNGAKAFVIVDAAMNDLIRPALYDAFHALAPVVANSTAPWEVVDVVGPVCESGDFLARDRSLPHLDPGDLVAVFGCGAYGFSMASTYNSRPRAAEVLVDGAAWHVIRRRETVGDLWRGERLL
ncbi:MAG: diaminopimelate decarboxylase [Myxococcales bacterium]|nr:diaminopimelate decarboxylase [Myxococcales bacterium]